MSCKRPKFPIDQDPDYEDIIAHQNKRIKLLEKDANEKSIKKIQRIVKSQFAHSIADKEEEIDVADQRLSQARMMLDRLRAYIVAGYYSAPEKFTNDSVCTVQTSVHPTIKTILCGKKPSCEKFKSEKVETQTKPTVFQELKSVNLTKISHSVKQEPKTETEIFAGATSAESSSTSADAGRGSRFKVSKKIIVGNTSQYIPDAKREPKDPMIYKWLVYVRAPEGEATIDSFVKKVSFVLHPSFGSNSVVEVSKPPFRIIRRGWGEFPIRVEIDFHDSRNKSKTIIHALKFDKAFTGFETRGSETIAEFHIYKPEKFSTNKSSGKTILSSEENVVKPDSDITENSEATDISNSFSQDTKESALLNETSASKQGIKEKTVDTERPPGKNVENDNQITTVNEPVVSKKEKVVVTATTEKRTAIKPQITVFPKKSTILSSPNSLSEKIVILSPGIEKKSGLSLIANRHEKIIVSPSANLIRTNDTAMTKQWTAGVSLLQKTKSKTTANHQQDSSKSANTLIIVPNANNNQEKRVFKVSADKKLSKSVQNNNNNNNNAAAPVLLLPADETKVLKTIARPTVKDTVGGTNGTYIKCISRNGETFLVPESLLKIPQQSVVVPTTTTVEAKSSSLPMYHLQVIPPTSSITQAHVVALNSIRNLVPSTILTTNAIKSSTHAQNTKLGSFFNTNSLTQMRSSSGKAVSDPIADMQMTRKHVEIESFDDMDDVMRYFVKFFSITAKSGVDKVVHPYCASSVDVFFSWNIGRQRAAEWQRAKAVQKLTKKAFDESAKWKDKEVWSAKKILWWCRRWGFSPMKTESEILNNEITPKVLLEYSEANELCTQLDESQKAGGHNKGENDEAEIDVVSLDDSVCTSNISTSPLKPKIFERIQLPSTPELEFIQDAVTQIGVKLKPVEVFPGVLANIVDEMLLKACKCFIDNITRRSLVQAFKRTGDKRCPSTLTLEDVCHCIETVPEFDFLTHKFLGKNNR